MEKKPTGAWGIASLVCGIVGLLLMFAPYFGVFLSVAAIVFYAIQTKYKPSGMGVAGLITGIIGTLINIVMLLFVWLIFSVAGGMGAFV